MDQRYSHQFHAGNVGDVWKHCVLAGALAALKRQRTPLRVIETHAGHGSYGLGPTGEWTEGIGKLWSKPPADPTLAVVRYLDLAPAARAASRRYPGSPEIILKQLDAEDRAELWEIEPTIAAALRTLAHPPRAEVHLGDGLASLVPTLGGLASDAEVVVHIDPPYGQKSDWLTIPQTLVEAWQARPRTRFLLWYPIKSYTRPNAMLKRLETTGMPLTTLELITTPLEWQRNRLNGSGMLLVNPPDGLVSEALAATPLLGRACATHAERWSVRVVSFAGDWQAAI